MRCRYSTQIVARIGRNAERRVLRPCYAARRLLRGVRCCVSAAPAAMMSAITGRPSRVSCAGVSELIVRLVVLLGRCQPGTRHTRSIVRLRRCGGKPSVRHGSQPWDSRSLAPRGLRSPSRRRPRLAGRAAGPDSTPSVRAHWLPPMQSTPPWPQRVRALCAVRAGLLAAELNAESANQALPSTSRTARARRAKPRARRGTRAMRPV